MSRYLIISRTSELYRFPIDKIVYMAADGNYTNIFLLDGKKVFICLQLGKIMKLMDEQLDTGDLHPFAKTKSYIINLDYLFSIDLQKQNLVLSNSDGFSQTLSLSRENLKRIKDRIDNQIESDE